MDSDTIRSLTPDEISMVSGGTGVSSALNDLGPIIDGLGSLETSLGTAAVNLADGLGGALTNLADGIGAGLTNLGKAL
ncbi:MAG: hypothetical protein ACYCZB_09130 [Acidiphilium sp.]